MIGYIHKEHFFGSSRHSHFQKYWEIDKIKEFVDLYDEEFAWDDADKDLEALKKKYHLKIEFIPMSRYPQWPKTLIFTELHNGNVTTMDLCQLYKSRTLVSISERGISLLQNLPIVMYDAINETQRMPKILWVKPGTSVDEILKLRRLHQWLPKGASFDLDRQPDPSWITEFKINVGNPHEATYWNMGYPNSRYGKFDTRIDTAIEYREATETRNSVTFFGAYLPGNEAPKDGSLIMIPMKHVNDTGLRECLNEFLMYVQIRHNN